MSPASSGTLEVERYIGACLISTHQNRHKNQIRPHQNHQFLPDFRNHQFNSNGYVQTCGFPLVPHQIPLARLTQGAPLVLSNRFTRRRPKQQSDQKPPPTDSISVTSDESSANSETCLPRIIKPRKRRKKDRKTPSQLPETYQPNPNVFNPYYDYFSASQPEEIPETPKLHHKFEDVKEAEDSSGSSCCQCSYCDPSNLIWDVDRNCYSPFLTTPAPRPVRTDPDGFCLVHSMSSVSLDDECEKRSTRPAKESRDLEVSTEIVTSPNGHRDLEIRFFLPSALESEVLGEGRGYLDFEE